MGATGYTALELIRLLLNFEADGDKLIQVILFGQPELARMVASRENLASRVVNTNWLKPLSQDETRAKHWPRRRREDGCFDWHWPAERIYNLIRALVKPWPGAFFEALKTLAAEADAAKSNP